MRCGLTELVVWGATAWAEQGIVGRGILIDMASWREKQSDPAIKNFNCFETSPIPLTHLQACLQDQGTEVKFGDILFIRTGEVPFYIQATPRSLGSARFPTRKKGKKTQISQGRPVARDNYHFANKST